MDLENRYFVVLSWILFILLWTLIPIVEFWPVYFHNYVFAHPDYIHHVFAIRSYFFDLWKNQELSFLFPDNLMGTSIVANPVYAVFYPLNFLHFVFRSIVVMRALVVIHYILLGAGWTLCFKELTKNRLASLLAATVFAYSGIVWSMHYRPVELGAMAWTGWVVYLFLLAIRENKLILSALSGIIAGFSYLAGDPLTGGLVVVLGFLFSFFLRRNFEKKNLIYLALHTIVAIGGLWVTVFPFVVQGNYLFPLSARSIGFSLRESMSYSTHPFRVLDLVLPWYLPPLASQKYPWPEFRYGISGSEWWYHSLALGIPATLLWLMGIGQYLRSWAGRSLALLSLLIYFCAMGRFLPHGEWLWSSVFPLENLRFPERLLRYAVLFLLPALAFGFVWFISWVKKFGYLGKVLVLGAFCITILEIHFSLPPVAATHASILIPPKGLDKYLQERAKDPTHPFRFKICNHYYGSKKEEDALPPSFDVRAWRLSSIFGSEASESPVIKTVDCNWALIPTYANWLGISHAILSTKDAEKRKDELARYGYKLEAENQEMNFKVFRLENSSPSLAIYSTDFLLHPFITRIDTYLKYTPYLEANKAMTLMNEGKLLIDHSWQLGVKGVPEPLDQATLKLIADSSKKVKENLSCQKYRGKIPLKLAQTLDVIELESDLSCPVVVSLPWNFIPGWRLEINGHPHPILRIGEATLGVLLSAGKMKVNLYFEPPGFMTSLAISGIFMVIIFVFSFSWLIKRRIFGDDGKKIN